MCDVAKKYCIRKKFQMRKVSYITELRNILRKSFVVNPFTIIDTSCTYVFLEEKFRKSVVFYEIYETFLLRNVLHIRYRHRADANYL